VTPKQKQALEILKEGPCMSAEFAEKMWPDSGAKNRQGFGFAGGGFLGKLQHRHGWVRPGFDAHDWWLWHITAKGLKALEEG